MTIQRGHRVQALGHILPGHRLFAGGGAGGPGVFAASPAFSQLSPSLPDGTGTGVTHPSVVDFGAGNTFNGYRYWMAYTPYPSEPDENPYVVASNDGWDWEEPAGISNPLAAYPGSDWNADTDLSVSSDGLTLRLIYIQTDGSTSDVLMRTSTDGTTWSSASTLFTATRLASPSLSEKDGTFYITYVKYGATNQSPTSLHRRSSTDLSTWAAEEDISYTPNNSLEAWHIEARYHSSLGKWFLLSCNKAVAATSINTEALDVAESSDGLEYTNVQTMFNRSQSMTGWDASRVYRATAVPSGDGLDLWYGGGGGGGDTSARAWDIGRTFLSRNAGGADCLLDEYATDAHGAYSLARYLKANFRTRPVALVRRDSDDALAFVRPNSSGALELMDGTALSTWLSAATAYCAVLYDQSGNYVDYYQADPAFQPAINLSIQNGLPGIVGNNSDYMISPNIRQKLTNSIAAVVQLAATESCIWGMNSGHYFGHQSTSLRIQMAGANINAANQVTTWESYIGVAGSGANASRIRRGGADIVVGTMATQGATARQLLMSQGSGGSQFRMLDGGIVEQITSNSEFSEADWLGIEASQSAFYDV